MDRQRIDKWLWHARAVRTRTSAAALVTKGHVRINGTRVSTASRAVRVGDAVTIALDRAVRVLKVLAFAERRGSAEAARSLCEDITPGLGRPAVPQSAPAAPRTPGAGRPTKRDRRAIDRLRSDDP